jgi:hypothetical protein
MEAEPLGVYVTARNDSGETEKEYGFGPTIDEAVQFAVDSIREWTGDESYVMDDWEAA